MSKHIAIRDDLYLTLKDLKAELDNENGIKGKTEVSFSDVIDHLLLR